MDQEEYLSKAFSLSQPVMPGSFTQDFDLDTQSEAKDDEQIDMDGMANMLQVMFLGFDLQAFAARLALLEDGLPLPEIFDWQEKQPVENLLELSGSERRTLLGFREILNQERKSGKYLQALQDLISHYPDSQELHVFWLTYLDRWNAEASHQLAQDLLAAHPDWLLIRLSRAMQIIMQAPPDELPEQAPQQVVALLDGRFELHQHLDGQAADDELVFTFYNTVAAYFIATHRFERALYSLNVCATVQKADPLNPLLFHLLMQMEQSNSSARVREFLNPLLKQKLQDSRQRA